MSLNIGRVYGELDQAFTWSCGFQASATDPACLATATHHGFKTSAGEIIHMAACCDQHLAAMQMVCNWAHPMDTPCGLPGAVFTWPENFCCRPDETYHLGAVEVAECH